jgi:hypothetical protein
MCRFASTISGPGLQQPPSQFIFAILHACFLSAVHRELPFLWLVKTRLILFSVWHQDAQQPPPNGEDTARKHNCLVLFAFI